MDVAALIARFRVLAGDKRTPPLWADETVVDWLNEAEREACIRAHLLEDDTTAAIVNITVVPGQFAYRLHPLVQDVKRLRIYYPAIDDAPACFHKIDLGDEETDIRAKWDECPNADGRPCFYAVFGDGDENTGRTLILDKVPSAPATTLQMVVDRFPLQPMDAASGSDTPEIHPNHHPHLLHWALHVAYQVRDIEGSAKDRVDVHEQRFINVFGERPDANVRRKRLRHRATICRPIPC